VDVSAQKLHARIGRNGAMLEVERTAEGIAALAAFCREHGAELVVMEATGGYEKLPFLLLWAAGQPCALANPRSVRRFAEGMGVLEKTDGIDTGLIAWYGQSKGLVAQRPPSEAQDRLSALVGRLGQLTRLIVSQLNQRRLQTDDLVLQSIDELLILLRRQSRALERRIGELIAADPLWRQLGAAFRTIKGVADRTVARLMADLPEIGTVSNKAIAKLAGLAPLARDSGQAKGRRRVRGGRASVRSILFVVADLVRRHNADFADFHRRLSERGKPKKAIRVAVAHKLLVRLNAKARDARRQLAIPA
jgi:transposase